MGRTIFHSLETKSLCKATMLDQLQNSAHLREYHKLVDKSKSLFAQKLDRFNQVILSRLDELIEKLPARNGQDMFQDRDRMRAATLAMDVRTSDHEPTFKSIASYVKKEKKMSILRIRPDLVRKRGLLELMEPFKNVKQVFVLVEQTETLGSTLIDQLTMSLRNRLESDILSVDLVFILFCTSSNVPLIELSRFPILYTISCDKEIESRAILEDLIRNEHFPFKLGPSVLDLIYTCFVSIDPSFANLELMFNYTMHEYFSRDREIKDNTAANTYHSYICDQLYYYLELLNDGHGKFPEDVTDLYDELFSHDELGHSVETVDAIKDLVKFPVDRILKRIDLVEKKATQLGRTKVHKPSQKNKKSRREDMLHILIEYKEKLINNEDSKEVVSCMRDELLEHIQLLKNPIKQNHGHIYILKLKNRSCLIRWLRSDKMNALFRKSYPLFEYLHDKIQSSPGHLSKNDLFNDMISDHPKLDEGLAKAVFIDLMDGMEQSQLIKWDKRRGNDGGMIQRLVWFV